jgi:hypothetical protein
MKNITVSVDDDTYRNARIKAAAMDTSISALVKRYLTELGSSETEFERLKRREHELRKTLVTGIRASDNIPRDELHDRSL